MDSSNMDQTSEEYTTAPFWRKWAIIGAIVVIVIAVAVIAYFKVNGGTFGGYQFFIRYKNAAALTRHSPVYLSGLEIGEVQNIAMEANSVSVLVKVGIKPEYANRLRIGTTFQKVSTPIIKNGQLSAGIEANVFIPTSPAIEKDQVVDGADDQLDAYLQMAKQQGEDFVNDKARLGEYRISTQIAPQGVSREFVLESGAWVPQSLFFSSILPEGNQWYKTENTTDSSRVVTVSGEFPNIESAAWNKSYATLTLDKKLFWTDYTYTETFPQGEFLTALQPQWDAIHPETLIPFLTGCATSPQGCIQKCISNPIVCIADLYNVAKSLFSNIKSLVGSGQGIPTSKLSVQFNVTMPGSVIKGSSNAEEISDSEVSWVYTGNELNAGVTLHAVSRVINITAIIMAVLITLLIVSLIIFLIWRRRSVSYEDSKNEE